MEVAHVVLHNILSLLRLNITAMHGHAGYKQFHRALTQCQGRGAVAAVLGRQPASALVEHSSAATNGSSIPRSCSHTQTNEKYLEDKGFMGEFQRADIREG